MKYVNNINVTLTWHLTKSDIDDYSSNKLCRILMEKMEVTDGLNQAYR